MTRVLHTGDTHIGYQQYHSPERRADFLAAFEAVIDDAIEMDVDAVVHAGDLFHDRRPDLPDLMGTLSALRDLNAADIPFLAVVGNHESTRGGQWLDLFERLGLATRLGDDPVAVGSTAFYGLDHVPESRREDLDYDFTPSDDSAIDADPAHTVLVGHGLFTPFAHANWDTETVLEESTVDFDAVLLGDNHAPGIERVDDVWVTYCGSTERASASEKDERGYNVVGFDADQPGPEGVDIRSRSLSDVTRDFEFIPVELNPGDGADRVRERVGQHDLADAVVIVEITGDGEAVTPGGIESFALDRGALIARVTDRREIETESELSVSFADPDAAVDERIEELGLSEAAHDIDEAVRSPDIADANLRETVKSRLTEQIENDPAALAPPERDDDGSEAAAESDSESDDTAASDAVADVVDDDGDDAETETDDIAPADSTADKSDTDDGELSTMEDFL
ncbi:DNA double-strand break repair protein Mre11 [Halonotius roseus]|uniref:DNA double-strand break repair protein Mre11 n=1 Tax=Halonotius roseus TaxID=2511997 RepID=A0A544QRF6_9EURY|nr:DNA double-strand break repair protein Mre11 [Halonotius roseus]TQQ82024.1 exonuclease SbcCD subunit D [Halonotius roseus]